MPVKEDRSVGWTGRSAAVTVLLAMEEHRKHAGLRLVQLREARGWNQEDLAHVSGLSVKTISRFENGRHDGRRSTLRKLAEGLGVEESEIVGEPPTPLGLGANNGADDRLGEILSLLGGLDERLANVEKMLVERELEDLEDEAQTRSRRPSRGTGEAETS